MTTDLIVKIDEKQAISMFTDEQEFDNLFQKIKSHVESCDADVTTKAGRDEIKSVAYKITKTKTTLDKMGKEVKDEAQKKVDAVNKSRKKIRETLDALKDDFRRPLTEFEAEEKRLDDDVQFSLKTIEALANIPFGSTPDEIKGFQNELGKLTVRNDWRGNDEQALFLIDNCRKSLADGLVMAEQQEKIKKQNEQLQKEAEKLANEKAERERVERENAERLAEQQRIEYEAKKAAEAENNRLRQELEAAQEREALAKRQAEQDAIDREKQAKIEAENARRAAIAKAEQEKRDEAERKEHQRIAEAEEEKLADEYNDRLIDATNDLIGVCGLTEQIAAFVMSNIEAGKISHVTFK